jgi:hypothetical protein
MEVLFDPIAREALGTDSFFPLIFLFFGIPLSKVPAD